MHIARFIFLFKQILERIAREELDVPVLKTRHVIKVVLISFRHVGADGTVRDLVLSLFCRHRFCGMLVRSVFLLNLWRGGRVTYNIFLLVFFFFCSSMAPGRVAPDSTSETARAHPAGVRPMAAAAPFALQILLYNAT